MADLYIPKRIKVGFQKRDDTFTKQLAYVICYDTKGKLRKEGSWQGWRDQSIAPQEFDNVPHGGFILNKGHTRYNYSHFGNSRRSVVRVYDDRGIEFEISPENCVSLLMETTCSKRVVEGECVYAWAGKDLVLLPVGSETYKEAVQDTKRQEMKVSAKEIKPGCSYKTKKNEEVIYIGKYNWFEWDKYGKNTRLCKKQHIFAHPTKPQYSNQFFPKDGLSFLASCNSPDPVADYATLVDAFSGTLNSSTITSWDTSNPAKIDLTIKQQKHYTPSLIVEHYAKDEGDRIDFFHVTAVFDRYDYRTLETNPATIKGFQIEKEGTIYKKENKKVREAGYVGYGGYNSYYDDWRHRGMKFLTEQEILAKLTNSVEVYMVLESGKKLQVMSLSDYGR